MTPRRTFLALLVCCLLALPAAHAEEARFTVHPDEFIGPPLVGFGAQFNPYLYAAPNLGGDVTDANVKDLERKLLDLRPQHVRIFFALEWWDGKRDTIAKDDPRMKESFLRTARLAQQCGASINLTYWHGPWPDPQRQASRFADIVKELRERHGLTSIRFITLQNEPNLHKFDIEKLTAIYRAFDTRARKIGLRDDVQLIGGDLVQNAQEQWFADLARHQPFLDGYAVHMYWDYWDTAKLLRRVGEVPEIVASLPPRARKPIYVTEFGVRGKRDQPATEPGLYEPDGRFITDVPLQGMQIAWFMMEAINRGYVATVQWDAYTAWYDRYMQFGVIGGAKDGWPLRPAYHVLRLFTHTTEPGWRAVRVDGERDGLLVTATRGRGRDLTVYALNRGEQPATVSIAGLPANAAMHVTAWNTRGDGRLSPSEPIKTAGDGSVPLVVPPGGLITLSNPVLKL
jgi:hypothetical protein